MATAYVDGELSTAERSRFKRRLNEDPTLREEVEANQALKAALSDLPRLKAPRNFVLDPAVYGKPARPSFLLQFYPQLRAATAVMSLVFIFSLSLNLWSAPSMSENQQASAPAVAMDEVAMEPLADAVEVEKEVAVDAAAEAESVEEAGEASFDVDVIDVEPTMVPTAAATAELTVNSAESEATSADDAAMAAAGAPAAEEVMEEEVMAEEVMAEEAMAEEAMASDDGFALAVPADDETVIADETTIEATAEPISPRSVSVATEEQVRVVTPTAIPTQAPQEVASNTAADTTAVEVDSAASEEETVPRSIDGNEQRANLISLLVIVQIVLGIVVLTLLTLTFVAHRQLN